MKQRHDTIPWLSCELPPLPPLGTGGTFAVKHAVEDAREWLRSKFKPLIDRDGTEAEQRVETLLSRWWGRTEQILKAWREQEDARPTRIPHPDPTGLAAIGTRPRKSSDYRYWQLCDLKRSTPDLHSEHIRPMSEPHTVIWWPMLVVGCAYKGDYDSAVMAWLQLNILSLKESIRLSQDVISSHKELMVLIEKLPRAIKTKEQSDRAKNKYRREKDEAIKRAKSLWRTSPSLKIRKDVSTRIAKDMNRSAGTIHRWLVEAEREGKLDIPPHARTGGRPSNQRRDS